MKKKRKRESLGNRNLGIQFDLMMAKKFDGKVSPVQHNAMEQCWYGGGLRVFEMITNAMEADSSGRKAQACLEELRREFNWYQQVASKQQDAAWEAEAMLRKIWKGKGLGGKAQ